MQQPGLRFLTLTIINQKDLGKAINDFYEAFTRFKRRKYFKENIKGGLGSIEIKKGKDDQWNVHGHFLIDSKYLDMKSHKKTGKDSKLVQEWKKCSRGSGVLFLRKVEAHQGSLNYILKYITKALDNLIPEEKATFLKATFKRRLIFTFGSFYKIKRPKKKKNLQYINPFSEEYQQFYNPKKKKRRAKNVLDYEKEVLLYDE